MRRVLTGYAVTFNRPKAFGYDFDKVVSRVSELFNMTAGEILVPSMKPERVRARSLVCFWGVTGLGLTGTVVGKRMGIVRWMVSKPVERGADLAAEHHIRVEDSRNR